MIGARPQLGPRGAGEAGRVAGGECGGARRAPLFAGRRGLRRAVVACDIGLLISSARARARCARPPNACCRSGPRVLPSSALTAH